MKIHFIGTGTMASTTRCNTSVLVDDILFDIGMGTVKQIERLKIYTKNINFLAFFKAFKQTPQTNLYINKQKGWISCIFFRYS